MQQKTSFAAGLYSSNVIFEQNGLFFSFMLPIIADRFQLWFSYNNQITNNGFDIEEIGNPRSPSHINFSKFSKQQQNSTLKMNHILLLLSFLSLFLHSESVDDSVKGSLISFLAELSSRNRQPNQNLEWNIASDPCYDSWPHLVCDRSNTSVRKLHLDGLSLSGTLQTSHLCNSKPLADSLIVLSINYNSITGEVPADIENCKQLTGFHLKGNKFHGSLPRSLARLVNLKELELSNNDFSGNLPELSRISSLTVFLAENNQFTGAVPQFDFFNLKKFNVSFNNFSGSIPINASSYFNASSFLGNPWLCGDPLPTKWRSLKLEEAKKKDEGSKQNKDQYIMYSGYIVLAAFLVTIVIIWLCKRKKKEKKVDATGKIVAVDEESNFSSECKTDFSMRSTGSGMVSSSLIVLTNPVVNGLKFEDLLKAPAELIGRGTHGSLYKVMFDYGMVFAVKRIKDWRISTDDFMQRMRRIDQARHPNVLSPLAFYSSNQEKLLVYEYQTNGSLFSLLHGSQNKKSFNWTSRIEVAAAIAKALAYMHKALQPDGIAHGNFKSSNILMNKNMEPYVSEYGLMEIDNQGSTCTRNGVAAVDLNAFKSDVYGFGVVLLELLTGKLAEKEGVDLTEWVRSVVEEEWTVEVFDSSLEAERGSEERMVSLLQVALACVERSPNFRPSMNQVAAMVNAFKQEEEGSSTSRVSAVMI